MRTNAIGRALQAPRIWRKRKRINSFPIKRLEEQANQSATALQKISATGEKLKDVGGKIEGAGKKLLPVTATVTALGAASVKTAADFESHLFRTSSE